MVATLQDIGATQQADGSWTYLNGNINKRFVVRFVNSNQGFSDALKTEGAHILFYGHSNFGLGQVFATSAELSSQVINNLLFVDDDKIFTASSPWVSPQLHYLRTTQAFPHFWPVFKDGTSAIMPYVFGDPRGNPAYNYYVTYQVPGDPTYYKIIYSDNGIDTAIVRFPNSGKSAWYSSTGATPNPSTQPQYFITNSVAWSPSFLTTGSWTESQVSSGYYKENYIYTAAGQGENQAQWLFSIPKSGAYNVSAWWSASSARTSSAPYTVNSASGDTTVLMDQRYNGKKWNSLGLFNFSVGNYSVVLTDAAPPGDVVADAIKIAEPNNPASVTQVNFFADKRYGAAPLTVNFTGNETGDVFTWQWNFGDGTTAYRRDGGDTIEHIYENPGTYAVSLTGTGSLGSSTKSKTGYIYVGNTSAPLQAEFRPSNFNARNGPVPLTLTFTDMSTGSISTRLWDFGDGTTSTSTSPSHTYSTPGIYTVKLTVTDAKGNTSTETKENIIRPVVFEKIIDNVDYPKNHFGTRTVLFRKDLTVPKEQMKYARMLYAGCDSAHYYTDTFSRGIMFYSVKEPHDAEIAMSQYLRAYMEGKSDYEIWQIMQDVEPVYDYYNFSKTPSQQ
jgi:PKD repeat protein